MRRLVLIDGKSVFYRGYYAMGALARADGTPTGGVYGFAAIAMEIVKRLAPTKVVVAWDSKTSANARREIYPEYKAGRVKPGEDFYAQIPLLRELVGDLGWNFVELERFEADDIIGTLSRQAERPEEKVESLEKASGDAKKRGSSENLEKKASRDAGKTDDWRKASESAEDERYETFIISSDLDMLQIVDENTHMWRIVKGFSEIQQIDIAEIEAKYGIRSWQFLDFKALKGDASDNIPGVPGVGEKTAAKLLAELETLDGIYAHLDEVAGATRKKLEAGRESAFMSRELARIRFNAPVSLSELSDFRFNRERAVAGLRKLEFNSLIRKFMGTGSAMGGSAMEGKVEGKNEPTGESVVAGEGSALGDDTAESLAKKDLTNWGGSVPGDAAAEREVIEIITPENTLVAWDVKGMMHEKDEVAKEILEGRPFWDLGQAAFLLNPLKVEQPTLWGMKELFAEQKMAFSKLSKVYKVFSELDLPLVPVLYKMEKCGMKIDRKFFAKLQKEYAARLTKLQAEVFRLAGREFNLNSTYQLSEVLFSDLGLPTQGIKKTARGYSTGAKELEKLRPLHPIIEKILEFREVSKMLSTYITPMPELADEEGRVHTTFTQNVTATGRLSSVNPNLQNIPVRTEEGRRIREGFIAPSGRVLVSADYAQFELRLAAVLSRDQALVADFNSGVDIHTKTAAEAFHVPFEAVTKEQRRAAKVINFGVLYGMSVPGLAEAAGMTIPEAKRFIDRYFELRAPIKRQLEAYLTQARTEGFVETYFGRRRPTPDIKAPKFTVRQAAERAAQNMPIQGTEADLMKKAMIAVDKALPQRAELVMQVHDSLIVECDAGVTEEVAEVLRREMEGVAPELEVKLEVEVTGGKNWGELG